MEAVASAVEGAEPVGAMFNDVIWRHRQTTITPKTAGQKRYIDAIRSNTIIGQPVVIETRIRQVEERGRRLVLETGRDGELVLVPGEGETLGAAVLGLGPGLFYNSPMEAVVTSFWVIPLLPVLVILFLIFLVSFIVQYFFSRFEIRRKGEGGAESAQTDSQPKAAPKATKKPAPKKKPAAGDEEY